ncbi:MAG: ABC transporter ATP-binding protein [Bacteroidetes bacterium]|nr:ABC transporter ATP-binding protein [Bacteroidota bacterium]
MILTARQLKKVFNRRIVFQNISFEVKSGEVLSITGPNGSGKSTASKMICGILTPTSGEIILSNGTGRIERDEVHRHIGFVSPYLELYGEFTAYENLQIELRARNLSKINEQKVLETLKLVGLFNRKDDALKGFSSGMKQRLKYAAALIHDPGVLVLDEPTANLDQAGVDMVLSVIESYRKDKIVILATNDSHEAALGDVKVVLKKDLGSGNGK